MTVVRWSRRDRLDLASIYAYIADDSIPAADALRAKVYTRVASLPDHPRAGRPGRLSGTREMVVHPHYILIYAETADQITVLRLLHSARLWP